MKLKHFFLGFPIMVSLVVIPTNLRLGLYELAFSLGIVLIARISQKLIFRT